MDERVSGGAKPVKPGKILLKNLPSEKQRAIAKFLDDTHASAKERSIAIRPYRAGELGLVSWRHCILYREEYGFDDSFEYYLLAGMAQYLHELGGRGKVWVADCGGNVVGSIAIVETAPNVGQLRWFLLEPAFRGLGLGRTLIETALEYSRSRGHERIFLWTVSELHAARHLYEAFGFRLTETKAHFIWGRDITEERWDLASL